MKIAAVVILYYPNPNVIGNIKSYLDFVDRVYILDNTEDPKKELRNTLFSISKSIYLNDKENKGIAVRLNQAAVMAIDEEFEWLLTMDQDSYFEPVDLIHYQNCISSCTIKSEVSMFGVEYIKKTSENGTCKTCEVEQMITSGSLVNLSIFKDVGGFDEALFIDEVDLEFCYKSISKGFKIIQFTNIFLNHSLGEISRHRSLKSLKSTSRTLHSPVRVYYMVRNFLYVNNKYNYRFKKDKKRRKKALINRIKNNFLYGEKRFLLIRLLIRAWRDYRNGKMGKIS